MLAHRTLVVVALALLLALPRPTLATCSPAALDAAHAALRDAVAPDCGTRVLHHIFKRAHRRAVTATARAAVQCQTVGAARISVAHNALMKAVAQIGRLNSAGKVAPDCALTYETELLTLDAALTDAANGVVPTTTTTTQPTCAFVTLEVDKGDCTGVTSIPRGVVKCGANCDVQTFTVPASRPLRLLGTPAPGDVGVTFDTDCDDDGTVPLATATPPDCSLSCDCSSGQ